MNPTGRRFPQESNFASSERFTSAQQYDQLNFPDTVWIFLHTGKIALCRFPRTGTNSGGFTASRNGNPHHEPAAGELLPPFFVSGALWREFAFLFRHEKKRYGFSVFQHWTHFPVKDTEIVHAEYSRQAGYSN